MVLAIEADPPFQKLRATAEYLLMLPVVLAGITTLGVILYFEQLLENATLMMALEANGENPFRWQEHIKSGKVRILPQPWPGQLDYPDIVRYDILYPGLPKI